PPVREGVFAWRVTTMGSIPYGKLILRQNTNTSASYTVKAWFLDKSNVARSSVAQIVDVPNEMDVSVSLAGDTSFTYPSEGWSYTLEISELMTGRRVYSATGPLPVDYDGSIIGF